MGKEVVINITEEKNMRTKRKKGGSYKLKNIESDGASWSLAKTSDVLVKNLRSSSLPILRDTMTANKPPELMPSSSNALLLKQDDPGADDTKESTHDHTTMNIGGSAEEETEEDIYQAIRVQAAGHKFTFIDLLQCFTLALLLGLLLASFILHKFKHYEILNVLLWKWCLMALVILCGELVTEWVIHFLVFFIEMELLFKNKALYYIYGLKKSIQICIWMPSFLLTWFLLFDHGFVQSSGKARKILDCIWKTFASALLVVVVAELKSFLVKKFSYAFYANFFFERIQERIYNKYILQRLVSAKKGEKSKSTGQLECVKEMKKGSVEKGVIDVGKLQRIKQENVSAWTMSALVNAITTDLITTSIDQGMETETDEDDSLRGNNQSSVEADGNELTDLEIASEKEAKDAAAYLFRKCAKPKFKYIERDDLLQFFSEAEVDIIFPMFEGVEQTDKIEKKAFRNWMVKIYHDHRNFGRVLEDNLINIEYVNQLCDGVVIIITPLIWLLLMGFPPAQVAIFLAFLLVPFVFLFANSIRALLESIVFIFVLHPFDVGDRCIIDGEQMVVKKMRLLKTTFLTDTNEEAYYPNTILAMKPIKNLYRSPEMHDSVDFTMDASTLPRQLTNLKDDIKLYLKDHPRYWRPEFDLQARELDDLSHLKMRLHVTHTMNYQNMEKKTSRKSDLILSLIDMLKKNSINFHLLPQEVHVHHITSPPILSSST